MTITANLHGAIKAKAIDINTPSGVFSLKFREENGGNEFTLFLPPAVAQATADAFNEAMEEHKRDVEIRRAYALYKGERAAGLHKPQEESDAELRDAGRGHLVRP